MRVRIWQLDRIMSIKIIQLLSIGFVASAAIGVGLYYAKDGDYITAPQPPGVTSVENKISPVTPVTGKSRTDKADHALSVQAVKYENTQKNLSMDYEQLIPLSVESVWEYWRGLLDKQTNQVVATAVLAQKLRQSDGEAIYSETAALLRDTSLSAQRHAQVVNLLGETSTPKSLELLAQILLETSDNTLRYAIAEAIGRGTSGVSEWELKAHPELSPILESLWQKFEPDTHTANAIAARITSEGAPSGIRLILEQLAQSRQTVEDVIANNDPRSVAALNSMKEVRNPESLPLLQQNFKTQSLESAVFVASGTALSSMGNIEATKTLLDWARQAPDIAAAQAQQWLGTAAGVDPESANFLKKELVQNDVFQSTYVKKGVLATMNGSQ